MECLDHMHNYLHVKEDPVTCTEHLNIQVSTYPLLHFTYTLATTLFSNNLSLYSYIN